MADLTSQSISIQSIYSWYREDRLYVNRRYQRKLVWTLEEKQKLIDSILRRFPIPAILIAEKTDKANSYEIIDGLQRLHAIVSFLPPQKELSYVAEEVFWRDGDATSRADNAKQIATLAQRF